MIPLENCIDFVGSELPENSRIRIKLGADPTRPDLHLGHAVVLKKLREFQDEGHKAILIIGDFTAMIGDPTGRNKTRPPLTLEETRRNALTYIEQCKKILIDDPDFLEIHFNSEWFQKFGFSQIIQLTSHYTLARMLERDDFSKRFHEHLPIGLHEMLYPLAQAYDSVIIKADFELGGTDQLFNLMVGRDIQRSYGQLPQGIMTCPLLVGTDGVQKMSKSEDNYIGLTESPESIFTKLMQLPDSLLESYFTSLLKNSLTGDIFADHVVLASGIVQMLYPGHDVKSLFDRYRKIARGDIPSDIECRDVTTSSMCITDLAVLSGFVTSKSDARRLIQNRGIKIDGEVVLDPYQKIDLSKSVIFQRGKDKFIKFRNKD